MLLFFQKNSFRIGKEKINTLIVQAEQVQSCLEMDPETTLSYVNYLSFLENAQKMVRTKGFKLAVTNLYIVHFKSGLGTLIGYIHL
jgi:hypothetical protein